MKINLEEHLGLNRVLELSVLFSLKLCDFYSIIIIIFMESLKWQEKKNVF